MRELHDRIVVLARERGVVRERKIRVDTTVVESNIHYSTDSGLLDDGARVLTRMMKKIEGEVGGLKRESARPETQCTEAGDHHRACLVS